ncbi:hypothetical protein ACIQ34_18345 [Ureibacillus sp. NPDC094379]
MKIRMSTPGLTLYFAARDFLGMKLKLLPYNKEQEEFISSSCSFLVNYP